jgi:hypothetical protein
MTETDVRRCSDALGPHKNLHNFFTLLHSTCRSYLLASCSMAPPSKLTMATISSLTEGVQLTPVQQRRSRISYSPVKAPKATPGLSHAKSMTFPQPKNETPTAQYDLPTAALEFEEFSFWGDDGSLHTSNLLREHLEALHSYLIRNYNASELLYCEPCLAIGCIPAEDGRPFSVAGLIDLEKCR